MNAQAQSITVKGVITSEDDNLPIPGVSVLVQGTNTGTISDFDGNFSVKAKMGAVLQFSYLGMTEKFVTVKSAEMKVAMASSLEDLEEVVVVGYGAVKKKEVTGAVAQVKAEQIEEFVTSDLASALQGQVSGVSVTASSGEPGESASIQIRGVTSLIGSNEPLYVVDGIAQQGNPNISPNEIETIDILKDAASAAVYGTEGAGGVILITTKQGKEGKMSVSFNTSYGVQTLREGIRLMDSKETLFFNITQVDNGASIFDPGPTRVPEWLNNNNKFDDYVLVNGASTSRHTLNVSGGAKGFSYNATVNYFDQDGTLINSGTKRIDGRASTSYKSDNWRINTSVGFTTERRQRSSNGLISNALRYSPLYPLVEPAEDVIYSTGNTGDGGVRTPLEILAQALKRKNEGTRDRINASLSISRDLAQGLSFTSTIGTAITDEYTDIFSPQYSIVFLNGDPTETDPLKSIVQASSTRSTTLSTDATLRYKKRFGDHNFGAQATFAVKEETYKGFLGSKNGVLDNSVETLDGGSINPVASSFDKFKSTQLGVLGRITYDYKGKYLLSALVRRDGSAKFSPNNQWATFPSITLGWNVSDEGFWSPLKRTINNFKIRAGRGTVGNNRFNNYAYQGTVRNNSNYIFDENDTELSFGSAVYNYANANVQWETKTESNIGFDMGFFRNKISLSVDFYDSRNKDMLFPVRVPGSAGAYDGAGNVNTILNVGNMTNKGFEIAAKYKTKIGKSNFNTNFTFTRNSNKITSTAGQSLIFNTGSRINSNDLTVFAEGYEAGAFWLYETNGAINTEDRLAEYQKLKLDAQMGDIEVVDYNKDGKIDVNDRHYTGSGLPDFEIGWNFQWRYKGFDLGMNWFASVGSEIINGNKIEAYTRGRHRDLLNMWSADNPTSSIPILRDFGTDNYQTNYDYWVESGDYLRLKLITLGYSLPKDLVQKIGLTNLRMFVSSQNPITITNYSGYDPEIGGNVVRRGIDASRYPLSALYTLGVNVKF
ncbi:TonB-dependent receptor [Postechiella marina]|uniref:TonB-dependent receptor n=1 Tax=Postechiella marina TaxID=943941 RepID=A0ABP8C0L4_9FLAO